MTDFKKEIRIELNKDINFIVDNLFANERFVKVVGKDILNGLKQISIILEESDYSPHLKVGGSCVPN